MFWEESSCKLNQENFLIFYHMQYPNLRMGFWVRYKENLAMISSGKCSHINELDVRLLNFSIRTSIDQVMVLLLRSTCRPHPVEVSRGQPVDFILYRSAEVSSSGLTTYDLQLWKVITFSSELRFGSS